MDEETNPNDQSLLAIAADFLWTGSYFLKSTGETIHYANADRLEKLLSETARVRNKYHNRLFLENTLEDLDTERDLENWEAIEIHNAWLNDVSDWMNRECLQKYNDLISEADAAKGKSKDSAGACQGQSEQGQGQCW